MRTLVQRLEQAAGVGGSVTFVSGEEFDTVPWAQVHEEARGMAARLQARGFASGDHLALLGPTTRNLVTAIQATWLAGGAVMVLPIPMRMASIEDFIRQTRVRIRKGDAAAFVIDDDFADFVQPEPGDPPFLTLGDLLPGEGRPGPEDWVRPDDDPERLAILQFTSGSTAEPKGVMLPHRVVGANLDAIYQATNFQPHDDVLVSWLPLYHDMGLVGMLCVPMMSGAGLVLGSPQDFMGRPLRWMEWLSRFGGTATAGPNFSWVLATKALQRAETLDLSRLRVALNGAEPVDPATVEAFIGAAERHGMRPGAVFPAFGMAELAIAGTFPEPMSGLRVDCVDRRVLETERYAAPSDPAGQGTRCFARLGRPVPGLEVRVVDRESGNALGDREVGELEIRGTSVTTGYYRNPDATAALFHDGWLRTGDLAYLLDGELVLCGRIKDVIILGGRNIFPEDIERAVAEVDGVRAGNVIAFGVEKHRGHEGVVVVAETKADDHDLLRREVHHRVLEVSGVPPVDVQLVEPGTLPKTSSGKLQRSLCKQRYLDGALEVAVGLGV